MTRWATERLIVGTSKAASGARQPGVPQGVHLKPGELSEVTVQKEVSESQQQKSPTSCALTSYQEVDAIFGAALLKE